LALAPLTKGPSLISRKSSANYLSCLSWRCPGFHRHLPVDRSRIRAHKAKVEGKAKVKEGKRMALSLSLLLLREDSILTTVPVRSPSPEGERFLRQVGDYRESSPYFDVDTGTATMHCPLQKPYRPCHALRGTTLVKKRHHSPENKTKQTPFRSDTRSPGPKRNRRMETSERHSIRSTSDTIKITAMMNASDPRLSLTLCGVAATAATAATAAGIGR